MILVPTVATLVLAVKVAAATFVLYSIGCGIYNRYFHPLRHFPGPFLASITTLWYALIVRRAQASRVQRPLHQHYGDIVRIAPNLLAIANADALETIYGPKNGPWRKAHFYTSFTPHIPGARIDGFSERDEAKHGERRRIIAGLYTQGSILQYEPCVDRVIDHFYDRMEGFCKSQEPTDIAMWLKRYTFDVIGEIYYGRQGGFGMVRDDVDYNNWCLLMDVMPDIGAASTYFPWGFQTLSMMSNMVSKHARTGLMGMFDVVEQSRKSVYDQWNVMQEGGEYPKNTMLTNMLEIVRDRGEKVKWSVADVHMEAWAVIWAGSDTTAISLASIFHNLHKNPDKLAILLEEIDNAFTMGHLHYPLRFNDARKLPYLHAVIMESMRYYPSLGTGLPREVPPQGATLCGTHIPGSAEVIMNSFSLHFDTRVFGADADTWLPERWLESEDRAAKMERSMLQFGYGPRICIGRNITQIEMYKLLPTMLREFRFELVGDGIKTTDGWFANIKGLDCRVSRRRVGEGKPRLVREEMR